jgi:hypothetical protein
MFIKRLNYYLNKAAQGSARASRRVAPVLLRQQTLIKKVPGTRQFGRLAVQYKLAFAIGSAIVASLILTAFSVLLYNVTGSAKLDLSRPGYESVRQKVSRTSAQPNNFQSTGPLNNKVISSYLKEYDKQSTRLSSYDAFNPSLLDDSQLGLSDTLVAPTDGANPN